MGVGFFGNRSTGLAEVFIDGVSVGVVDTYRRTDSVFSKYYPLASGGEHTIMVRVLDQRSAFSNNDYVHVDFIDVWDGTTMPDGRYEQNDGRVYHSTNYRLSINSDYPTDDQIVFDGTNSWFLFTGDSVSFNSFTDPSWGKVAIYIDGNFIDYVSQNAATRMTETVSFDGLGDGAHVMRVARYRGRNIIDAFSTPGVAPFYEPPSQSDFFRYEEENGNLLFNGVPLAVAPPTWNIFSNNTNTSDGQGSWTDTTGDSIELTFDGEFVGVGFLATTNGGRAEVFIDNVSAGVIDTYRRTESTVYQAFPNLGAGSHTVRVVNLGDPIRFSSRSRIHFDFFDVWNGTPLPTGVVEQDDARVYRSNNWINFNAAGFSGGTILYNGTNMWYPFTGDSAEFAWYASSGRDEVAIYIDGQFVDYIDQRNPTIISETLSFNGLGSGVHVLQMQSYQGSATVDYFASPGSTPLYAEPDRSGYFRYEEDDVTLRFNGAPLTATTTSWAMFANNDNASDGYASYTDIISNNVVLTATGDYIGVGFVSSTNGGIAEIIIDGNSQGEFDTYSRVANTLYVPFDNLGAGQHTVEVRNTGTKNPLSTRTRIHFDYFDVWDGTPLASSVVEQDDERIYRSNNWNSAENALASGGSYLWNGSNIWFPFEGDSVNFHAWGNTSYGQVTVLIDGQRIDHFDLYSRNTTTPTFSFDGLGAGIHILQVQAHRGRSSADAFETPGTAPFYSDDRSGIYRYEEDHLDLRYNGDPLLQASTAWRPYVDNEASRGNAVYIDSTGVTVTLNFTGTAVAPSFVRYSNASIVEVFIDGISQGTIDTYGPNDTTAYQIFDGLAAGPSPHRFGQHQHAQSEQQQLPHALRLYRRVEW